jgi:hypothetical protein
MIDELLEIHEDQKDYVESLHYNLNFIIGELEHLQRVYNPSNFQKIVLSQKELNAIKTAKNQLLKIWRS